MTKCVQRKLETEKRVLYQPTSVSNQPKTAFREMQIGQFFPEGVLSYVERGKLFKAKEKYNKK